MTNAAKAASSADLASFCIERMLGDHQPRLAILEFSVNGANWGDVQWLLRVARRRRIAAFIIRTTMTPPLAPVFLCTR